MCKRNWNVRLEKPNHEWNTRRFQVKNIFADKKLFSELACLTITVLLIIVGSLFESRTFVK
jgi:hypothetical protein